MKKIINGKKYDTNTATFLGSWSNGYSHTDFHHCYEELYQKKNGEYFLAGEGHGFSKYASESGNSRGWGSDITPLTKEEAFEWAQDHLNADKVEEIFGMVEE